jgi:hypothetical protein
VCVLEGNIMLLYLSQDLKYAAIASIFSIFTEVNAHARLRPHVVPPLSNPSRRRLPGRRTS